MNQSVSQKLDMRWLQIFLLSLFLSYGLLFLGWDAQVSYFLVAIGVCMATQTIWILAKDLSFHSLKSAMISALGLCLLLHTASIGWMALAAFLTISAKFVLRVDGKHIFNPTNLGIIAIILLGGGWVSPGQWGSGEAVYALFFSGAALVLFGVKRWDVAVSFLASLFILESIRTVGYLGWEWDVVLHKFESGTVILFAFFMITDPRTSPNSRKGRVVWAMAIATLSFIVSQFFYFYAAPLVALFICSMATPVLNRLWKGEIFQWNIQPKTQNI